jgi:hypothetical protein
MNEIQQLFEIDGAANISIPILIFNFFIGFIISQVIAMHFKRFGSTLSSRAEFSQVLPFILMTTLLVIMIVKSSLALSLGLVGALSIVRFRTPIKEPEELAYLFLAIAAGLGLGANQVLETVISVGLILIGVTVYKSGRNLNEIRGNNVYLTVSIDDGSVSVSDITSLLGDEASRLNLRRLTSNNGKFQATFLIEYEKTEQLDQAITSIKNNYTKSEVTFIDQSQIPGI